MPVYTLCGTEDWDFGVGPYRLVRRTRVPVQHTSIFRHNHDLPAHTRPQPSLSCHQTTHGMSCGAHGSNLRCAFPVGFGGIVGAIGGKSDESAVIVGADDGADVAMRQSLAYNLVLYLQPPF